MEAIERPARKTYIDLIRILACIGVIYNHVMGERAVESGETSYAVLFAYSLSKLAVPLFLMLTGALLLPRIDSYRKTLWRFVRIALALALAVSVHYTFHCVEGGAVFEAKQLILSIYRDRLGITYSYWYLYRYLSLLVMLPLLQRMTARMTTRDVRYFLLFAVGVCGCALTVDFLLPQLRPNEWLTIPLFSVYIGMLYMGYYVDHCMENRRGYRIAAGVGLVLFNALAAFFLYLLNRANPGDTWRLDRCDRTSTMLAAGCAYYLIKCADGDIPVSDRMRGAISRVGRLTFAVYLVSELLIEALAFIRIWYHGCLPMWCADRLYVATVFLVGIGVAAILTRIPLLKKLL